MSGRDASARPARAPAPGRWLGAARGPVAAAFGPGPWEAFGLALARIGYRLLVVERGADLDEAMAGEGMPDDATVVGQAAGAREATLWVAANPHRTRRLVLIAPEGVLPPEPTVAAAAAAVAGAVRGALVRPLARLPVLGPWLARRPPPPAEPAPPPPPQPLVARPSSPLEAPQREVARAGTPVIALWGGADEAVPLRALGDLALWNRQAKHEVIEGAGHDLLATHPGRVAEVLRDVLREDF